METPFKLQLPHSDPYTTRPGEKPYKLEILWDVVIGMVILHLGAAYNLIFYWKYVPSTLGSVAFTFIYGFFTAFGITIGSHRCFSHRSFKASRPLQLFLILLQTAVFQYSIIKWVYYHRLHHKYTDTNADHTNATRGFFFSHIGWLMVKRHPDVAKWGAKIDMSDIENDPVIQFQHKYFVPLGIVFSFLLPALVNVTMAGFTFEHAIVLQITRHVCFVHIIGLINSYAHHYGDRPFDKNILPADSVIMDLLALGEGSHNYHHVFPWDYRSSEVEHFANVTTIAIRFLAWLGLATDLKTASPELIKNRVLRTGDGSHHIHKSADLNGNVLKPVWGWNDYDLSMKDKEYAKIMQN